MENKEDDILNYSLDELIQRNAIRKLHSAKNNNTREKNDYRSPLKMGGDGSTPPNNSVSLNHVTSESNLHQISFQGERWFTPHSNSDTENNVKRRFKRANSCSPFYQTSSTETSFHNKENNAKRNCFKRGGSCSPYPINRSHDDNSSGIYNQRSFNRGRSCPPYTRNYYNNSDYRYQQNSNRYMPYRREYHGVSSILDTQYNLRHCNSCRCLWIGSQGFQNSWRKYSHNPRQSNIKSNLQKAKSCESIASATSFQSFRSNKSQRHFYYNRRGNNNNRGRCQRHLRSLNLDLQAEIQNLQQNKANKSAPNFKVNAHECKPRHVTTSISLNNRFKELYDKPN